MEKDVFKALADPTRRKLLDLLYSSDGQTLHELCEPLDMSRFGVMKHLNILEEAELLTTKKVGREKLHYLNAVPIRQLYNRWVSKYTEPWIDGLTSLQTELEREANMENRPAHINRIAIKAKPERIWNAITTPEMTSKFWFNCEVRSTWEIDSAIELWNKKEKKAEGIILDIHVPHKLMISFRFHAFPGTECDTPSRITWEIHEHEQIPGTSFVTVTHDEFENAETTARVLENGLPLVISGLKTLLETGKPLDSK
jgi:DNA-binding transcriptional ArsR family regulator